ncbi:MAG: YbaN family protein [Alphaproteobacteria bacterium]
MTDVTEQGGNQGAGRHWLARKLWCAAGLTLVGLGGIGAVVPGLPTTVFLILALACFDRGSPRFHKWLMDHACWGPILRDWKQNGAVPRRAKRLALAMMALSVVIFHLTVGHLGATLGLAAVLTTVGIWLWTRPDATMTDDAPGCCPGRD